MLIALLAAALAVAPTTESFALVVTNNRSLSAEHQNLHYADDDGVAYADLFVERFGSGKTVLLTELDPQTRAIAPGWSATPPPSLVELDRAIATLAAATSTAKQTGARTELYVVLAGHGDVADGVGYLELLDGRLTSRDLEERIIKKLKVDRLHLIIDSCNSYFMLNPRKPGGRRWAADALPTGSLTSRYPWVGTIVSTNAEAVSYEWSELQSGIFSYEVRSGLRGAADANGDQVVTYPELAAFIDQANKTIVNEQYRPRVFFTEPGKEQAAPLIGLTPNSSRAVTVQADQDRRFIVRNALGVRVLDVNQEAGTTLTLVLPAGDSELGLYERIGGEDRPRWVYRSVPPGFQGNVEALAISDAATTARGESPIFEALFSAPFGRNAYTQFVAAPRPEALVAYGVTRHDIDRLDAHLLQLAIDDKAQRANALALSSLLSTAALAATSPHRAYEGLLLDSQLMVLSALEITEPMRLLERLRRFDVSSDAARAKAVEVTERDFALMAERSGKTRKELSVLGLVLSGGLAASGFGLAIAQKEFTIVDYILIGAGGFTGILSLAMLTSGRTTIEKAWADYQHDAAGPEVHLNLGPGSVGVGGSF